MSTRTSAGQENMELLAQKGRAAIKEKDWTTSLKIWKNIERLEKENLSPSTLYFLAKSYSQLNKLPKARSTLSRAYELYPNNMAINFLIGEFEFGQENYDKAVHHFRYVLAKYKSKAGADLYRKLAIALKSNDRTNEADEVISAGILRFGENKIFIGELSTMNGQGLSGAPTKKHPYQDLPQKCFWNRTVSNKNPLEINDWYVKKFNIQTLPVATAGSCFAQHIGRQLRLKGFEFIDAEPSPAFLSPESHLDFGYGMYSARFGNIYTSRQLLQLLQRATGQFTPKDAFWVKDNGFVDPFRPTIEPEPFESVAELEGSRKHHLAAVIDMIKAAGLFVFTMGLTEAWTSNEDGAVFPVAPGVSGGNYDPEKYSLKNLSHSDVLKDMELFFSFVRKLNKNIKFILTVSPVPLMATATDHNVVSATTYSKSVLRSVAGELANKFDFVDYFPSYEIISSHVMRGGFFNPDMRTVSAHGVEHVMKQFFSQHVPLPSKPARTKRKTIDPDDIACDEELLETFGEKA